MKTSFAIVLIAACALSTGAAAQKSLNPPAAASPAACPETAQDLPMTALYGAWEARFDGLPGVAAVRFGPHPDYAGVRGTITRAGAATAQLAGDIDDEGQLSLDESQDGRRISGNWAGPMVSGSCGRSFEGTWRNAADDSIRTFVLTKTGPTP